MSYATLYREIRVYYKGKVVRIFFYRDLQDEIKFIKEIPHLYGKMIHKGLVTSQGTGRKIKNRLIKYHDKEGNFNHCSEALREMLNRT